MANVLNVAHYILHNVGEMTTMKLQKLTYYCQAWSLAWDGVPLFDEDFQAWANGPVCPELFEKHKGKFIVNASDFSEYEYTDFKPEGIETMDAVLRDLGEKTGQWLSDLTHSERPWLDARQGCQPGERCTRIIEKDAIQEYYASI